MSLVLDHVGLTVGQEVVIDDVSLTFERGHHECAARRHARRQDDVDAADAGLDKLTTGTIHVHGKNVAGIPVRRRSVAMVYQQFVNYPSPDRSREYRLAAARRGLAKAEIEDRVSEASRCCGLDPFLDRLPASFQAASSSAPRSPVRW